MVVFGLYLLWACGFSPSIGGGLIQICATVPIFVYFWLHTPGGMSAALFRHRVGLLACVGALAACVSAFFHGFTVASLSHYLMLVPAFAVLLVTCSRASTRRYAEWGLCVAAFVFTLFQALFTDFSRFSDLDYRRVGEFFNANVIGFVACMSVLAHASLWVRSRKSSDRVWVASYLWTAMSVGFFLLFMTRCRGALAACLGGLCVLAWVCGGRRVRRALLLFGVSAGLAAVVWSSALAELLDRYYGVFSGARSVATFSHRSAAWDYAVNILSSDTILGSGPREWDAGTSALLQANSPHNGFLYFFTQVGVLGTLPYLVILGSALARAGGGWSEKRYYAPLVFAGLLESLVESYFFSLGNPGFLLFLFAVVIFSLPVPVAAVAGTGRLSGA